MSLWIACWFSFCALILFYIICFVIWCIVALYVILVFDCICVCITFAFLLSNKFSHLSKWIIMTSYSTYLFQYFFFWNSFLYFVHHWCMYDCIVHFSKKKKVRVTCRYRSRHCTTLVKINSVDCQTISIGSIWYVICSQLKNNRFFFVDWSQFI